VKGLKILMWKAVRSTHPAVWEIMMLIIKYEEIFLIAKFFLN